MTYDRATTLERWRPGPMVRWQRYFMVVWQPPEEKSQPDGEGDGEGEGEGTGDGAGEGTSPNEEGESDDMSQSFSADNVEIETRWSETATETGAVEDVPEDAEETPEDGDDQPERLGWNTHGSGPKLDPSMGEHGYSSELWERLAEEVSAALAGQATLREAPNDEAPDVQPRAVELGNDPVWTSIVDMVRGQPALVRSVGPALVDQLVDGRDARERLDGVAQALSQLRADLSKIAPGLEDVNPEEIAGKDERIALADKLLGDPRIKKVLELAGRIASQAFASRTVKAPSGRDEVKGIERGSDITRTLASQLVYLADPDLEALFLKDFTENALLQYQFEGKERARRGPIAICLDQSGSMEFEDPKAKNKLLPNDIASAIAIGALRMAHAQQRDVYLCGFDEEILWVRVVKKTASPLAVAEVVQFLVGRRAQGGTTFDKPLAWAVGLIEQSRVNADIIFLTDGHGDLQSTTAMRLRNAKAKQGLGMFLLLINAEPRQPLVSLADAIVQVHGEEGCLDFGQKFVTTEREDANG